jgi:hypothetical protein
VVLPLRQAAPSTGRMHVTHTVVPAHSAGKPAILACGESSDIGGTALRQIQGSFVGTDVATLLRPTVRPCTIPVVASGFAAFVLDGAWGTQTAMAPALAQGNALTRYNIYVGTQRSTHTPTENVGPISAVAGTSATAAALLGTNEPNAVGEVGNVNTLLIVQVGSTAANAKAFFGGVGPSRDIRISIKLGTGGTDYEMLTASLTFKPIVGK